jgi:diguanylate cyclase (GGDEF)-like protein
VTNKTKKIDITPSKPGYRLTQTVSLLSSVEREILGLIKQGMTNEEIGKVIGKSKWTVKFHLGKVMRKFGVKTRVQAVSYAMGHGVIAPSNIDDFLVSKPSDIFTAGIVGGGDKAASLLEVLKKKVRLRVEWIVEADADAPAIAIAKEMGIRVVANLAEVVASPLDMIIDLSGSDVVAAKLLRLKAPKTELLSGLAARLMWRVGCQHEKNKMDHKFSVSAADKRMIEGLGDVVCNVHGVKDVASAIVSMALRLTGSSAGLLAVCDEAREYMTLVAASGYSRRLTESRSWKISNDGLTSMALDRDTPLLIPDLSEFPTSSPVLEREGVKTLMVAPLTVDGKLVGMLQVSDINHGTYTNAELSLFSLVNVYAGRLLNKARHIEVAQQSGVKDALTRLYNRDFLMEQLRLEILRGSRHEENLALLVINIDGYRQLLKTHGALEVNGFLRAIGGYLNNNLRDIDIAARMQEGEFCLLTPMVDAAGVKFLSERLVRELTALPALMGAVTFKAGTAVYPEDGILKRDLIKKVGASVRLSKDKLSRRYFKPTPAGQRPATL